jgi:D-glycero-D-manno-heptose 1,7-bisphosphate phosphatase
VTAALFLDRDGVINEDTGYTHIWSDDILIPGITDLVLRFKQKMFKIIIITNQSGIGRGYYDDSTFHFFMTKMREKLIKCGVDIDNYYYCSCDPSKSNCVNRKPEPNLFFRAALENNINLQGSVMVGDKISDLLAAHRAEVSSLYLFDRSNTFSIKKNTDLVFTIVNNLEQIKG